MVGIEIDDLWAVLFWFAVWPCLPSFYTKTVIPSITGTSRWGLGNGKDAYSSDHCPVRFQLFFLFIDFIVRIFSSHSGVQIGDNVAMNGLPPPKRIIHGFRYIHPSCIIGTRDQLGHVRLVSSRAMSSNKKLHSASGFLKSWCVTLTNQRVSLILSSNCRSCESGGNCIAQSVQIENASSCRAQFVRVQDQL